MHRACRQFVILLSPILFVFIPRMVSARRRRRAGYRFGKSQAQAALREGNTALEQGRAGEALAKFTEAYRLFPSPKIHYNLGQAHGLIAGHEAQAYQEMSLFLAEAKDADPSLRGAAETLRAQLQTQGWVGFGCRAAC